MSSEQVQAILTSDDTPLGECWIKKQNSEIELARFHPNDAELLLKFNIKKQRVVDLCNREFENDPFDQGKNYSSWHRALDGKEVWEGIVQALDGLLDDQIAHPRKYLPTNDPGDDLRGWMAQISKATWWHEVLELDMSLNSLNSWFSGRISKTNTQLREQVEIWWSRVKFAADEAERHSAVATREKIANDDREQNSDWDNSQPNIGSWDTWCKDLLEDGVSGDQVRERFVSTFRIRSAAVVNWVLIPALAALWPIAMARWVLPTEPAR